ncbi:MAG: hypothetical protein E5V92_15850 [Mesorhizobium sp.]|nr:MAG: hypothetical protein E5V92_15850 [Mesorhizobium sp.]
MVWQMEGNRISEAPQYAFRNLCDVVGIACMREADAPSYGTNRKDHPTCWTLEKRHVCPNRLSWRIVPEPAEEVAPLGGGYHERMLQKRWPNYDLALSRKNDMVH